MTATPAHDIAPDDLSWWLEEALLAEGTPAPAPPLSGQMRADVAIVGGGFTGLWTALALKERAPNLSIVLIEAAICGAGASGKNGGKCHGYLSSLPSLVGTLGPDAALSLVRAGTRAQDGIRTFASAPGRDVWWREAGNVRVSCAPAQDARIAQYLSVMRALDLGEFMTELSPEAVSSYCRSPVFRRGVYLSEGATLHPARLARALRAAALAAGVTIHENSRMTGIDPGGRNRVRTAGGEIVARDVVLATNTGLAADPDIRSHVTVFSSYALMTEPAPEALSAMGWTGDVGFSDARMFLHYFRKTPDGRVLMGAGSGPISSNGDATAACLTRDRATGARAVRGLRRLLPGVADAGVARIWGGGIDVSSDRLPLFRTRPGTRVHYACGYSGHGVNATYIGGQCLASLVLEEKNDWSALPFCTRALPRLPPEPFRTSVGRIVQRGIIACEEAEEAGTRPPLAARAAAAIPRMAGMRIGTR